MILTRKSLRGCASTPQRSETTLNQLKPIALLALTPVAVTTDRNSLELPGGVTSW